MGLFSTLFGGSSSSSGNQNADYIKQNYGGDVTAGQNANAAISSFLTGGGGGTRPVGASPLDMPAGIGGHGGALMAPGMAGAADVTGGAGAAPGAGGGIPAGLQNFLDSTGYNFQLGQGMQAITGNAAARGLLNSGSTLKALNKYGQGLAGTYAQNWLDNLNRVADRGVQAGQLISNAGQTSKSSSSKGVLGAVGSIVGGIFCDARAKDVGEIVGTLPNGVELREFTYRGSKEKHVGPIAQQVRKVLPDAVFEDGGLLFVNMRKVLETPRRERRH